MKRFKALLCACSILLAASLALAESPNELHELRTLEPEVDVVGDRASARHLVSATLQDTIWIADWTFDDGDPCNSTGWIVTDNRILSDSLHHWKVRDDFAGVANMIGSAAQLGEHDLCWDCQNGYDNDWHSGLRFEYQGGGANYLSFDYIIDSEGGFDFLQVEVDSACSSFDQVNYDLDPGGFAAEFRDVEFAISGFDTSVSTTSVDSLLLTDYGPGTHCAYISFFSDGAFACSDGLFAPILGLGAAVDNIVLEGNTSLAEDFEGSPPYAVTFENLQDTEPFGTWARVFPHATDNDLCTENRTCSWIFTDDTTPTIALDPSMAFGPGSYVIRNWLDSRIHSPWVSLASTPGAVGTVLSFRRFPANFFVGGRIVQSWSVRGKSRVDNTDTPAPGDSIDCISAWGHAFQHNSLSVFRWVTAIFDMEQRFSPNSTEIQVRFRVSDWQFVAGAAPPTIFNPGPGPYIDRVRIGRRILTGPAMTEGIDSRMQAQDAFATDPIAFSGIPNWTPSTDRFGSAAFSRGGDLALNATSGNLILGDSITVQVEDVRGAGGITSVEFYGRIVAGPHATKAPPPYTTGANGFFVVPADSVRNSAGNVVEGFWFVSLDDEYFRGGDALQYIWLAADAQGGVTSDPLGLSAAPVSPQQAQDATGGLLEVNYLPKINWDPAYVARVQVDAHGKFEPTAAELLNSSQANCILYYQNVNSRRLSGDANRTSLMYTLDTIGYRDLYDVYDHQGLGNTNNHLGGRATVAQATGYSLILYDAGNRGPGAPILPDGVDLDAEKIDQAAWFRNYLAQATISEAGIANLWIIGANALEEKPTNLLYTTDMSVALVSGGQGLNNNPDITGEASVMFSNGNIADFTGDLFSANGGCPTIRNYDALDAGAGATATHRYKDPEGPTLGDGAIVMKANVTGQWNTTLQAIPWFDIRDPDSGPASPTVEQALLTDVLDALLPLGCEAGDASTDVPSHRDVDAAPRTSVLHQNAPNPLNPVTTIRFELSHETEVRLRIYDVAGRLIATLVDESLSAGRHAASWNGLDDAGQSVSSGVYFYRIVTDGYTATRKLVVAK